MKKNLTIIASAVLALGMLFVTGCKHDAPVSVEKVGRWDTNSYTDAGKEGNILKIEADKAISWWVITDTNGKVVHFNSDAIKTDSTTSEVTVTDKTKIAEGKTVSIDFSKNSDNIKLTPDGTDFILWTHMAYMDEKANKKEENKQFAARGKVKVFSDKGRLVKASKCPEYTMPVSVLRVACDERAAGHNNVDSKIPDSKGNTNVTLKVGNGHGDYKITEVWPLRGVTTQEGDDLTKNTYEVIDDFSLTGLNIGEGEYLDVIFPADEKPFFLAVNQPERYNPSVADDKASYENQKNWLWCYKTIIKPFDASAVMSKSSTSMYRYDKEQNKVFGEKGEVRASNPAYFIKGTDLVEAADEK